ncbi:hypothetical protein EAO72_15455 [Streptomyces sp. or43]|nr:hypothetical protein EAO72_15455 [Streptomyces sp. or43]
MGEDKLAEQRPERNACCRLLLKKDQTRLVGRLGPQQSKPSNGDVALGPGTPLTPRHQQTENL